MSTTADKNISSSGVEHTGSAVVNDNNKNRNYHTSGNQEDKNNSKVDNVSKQQVSLLKRSDTVIQRQVTKPRSKEEDEEAEDNNKNKAIDAKGTMNSYHTSEHVMNGFSSGNEYNTRAELTTPNRLERFTPMFWVW